MQIYIAALVIFALAFLGLAVSVLRKKHCLGCSCKAARKIMEMTESEDDGACGHDLIRFE